MIIYSLRRVSIYLFILILFLSCTQSTEAATLKMNPNTGVYTVGKTFTVSIVLNTEKSAVNASDGQIAFNPRELQVTGVSRTNSIFNLWTEEPSFSNTAGVVSFGGGSPTGYSGTSGNIINITFKPLGAGNPKLTFKSGSVLAADGLGTNVLTTMSGGTYTVSAVSENPEPEYIAPANTPKAPQVISSSHPDQSKWYTETTANLSWELPKDIVAIRTLLDSESGTIPTIVYDEPVSEKVIEDLPQGISYFHIQFKNKEGWGKITHYRVAVDTESPTNFTISEDTAIDSSAQAQVLSFTLDDISPIGTYKIQIDGGEPLVYTDEKFTKKYTLETLAPGHHTVIVEAFDSAGNSSAATYSFDVMAFEKPIFVEYPTRINTEVIPAIKGTTKPNARVTIHVVRAGDGSVVQIVEGSDGTDPYTIQSNELGEFTYIPDTVFEKGVYVITARAKDNLGRLSEVSDEIKIIVETPGYIMFGTTVINVLSVLVPLLALVVILIFGTWYLWHRLLRWKKSIFRETYEAEEILVKEFSGMIQNLDTKVRILKESRKGKLTKAESDLISQIEDDLKHAQKVITKEIVDIENVVS